MAPLWRVAATLLLALRWPAPRRPPRPPTKLRSRTSSPRQRGPGRGLHHSRPDAAGRDCQRRLLPGAGTNQSGPVRRRGDHHRAGQPRMGPDHASAVRPPARRPSRRGEPRISDGPTEFSRDRNDYRLARDANGVWKVAGDDHPDGARPATRHPSRHRIRHRRRLDVEPGPSTSRNWSGYAARGGTFTSVAATWTVPQLAVDGPFGADADVDRHWRPAQSRLDPGRHPAGRRLALARWSIRPGSKPCPTCPIPSR